MWIVSEMRRLLSNMGSQDDLKNDSPIQANVSSADALPIAGPTTGGDSPASGVVPTIAGSVAGTPSETTTTPVRVGRTLLIHGYSASGKDLEPWRDALAATGIDTLSIAIGNYVTLNNQVTIKDLGEAFDRALRLTPWSSGSKDDTWTFDAVVHSTGILVLRQWLSSDPFDRDDPRSRIQRLKHLVGLAPATFGSPQAKEGRSWLGALVKGNKDLGPDFLNAGDLVLDGLELGSSYTWDLAHKDMLSAKPLYGKASDTPYVTVFIGNIGYTGVSAVANSPGSDGTVRWAGCALNTRKVSIDFRREPKLQDANGQKIVDAGGNPVRFNLSPWESDRLAAPVIAVDAQNHGSIVSDPDPGVVALMSGFFNVTSETMYEEWEKDALAFGADSLAKMDAASSSDGFEGAGWQQLVVHAIDDHGDPITDYNLQIYLGESLDQSDDATFPSVPLIPSTYSGDNSYRCFYIRLSKDMLALNTSGGSQKKMWLELIASSGSALIEYEAYTGEAVGAQRLTIDHLGGKPVKLDITDLAQGDETLLYPYTTTLLEIFIEREPLPLDDVSQLFNFM